MQKIIDYELTDALKSFTIRGLISKGKLVNKENLGVSIWTTKTSCCGMNVFGCTLDREAYVKAFRQQPTWATINAPRNYHPSQPLTNRHRSHGACAKDPNCRQILHGTIQSCGRLALPYISSSAVMMDRHVVEVPNSPGWSSGQCRTSVACCYGPAHSRVLRNNHLWHVTIRSPCRSFRSTQRWGI